jgi:TRAP-type mannitol/chloroaromatic compound transport system permease large subunit
VRDRPQVERWRSLGDLAPPLVIFAVIIGSIYTGMATATESAALGVIAALVLAGLQRKLTVPVMLAVFEGTMRTTAMIMLILVAAFFLNFVMAGIGLTAQLNRVITGLIPTRAECDSLSITRGIPKSAKV